MVLWQLVHQLREEGEEEGEARSLRALAAAEEPLL